MKEEIKNKAMEILKNGLKDKIVDIIWLELGMKVDFQVSAEYYPWSEWVILMYETSDASKMNLTYTPVLKQMFSDAKMSVKVEFDGKDNFTFRFKMVYTHSFNGGTNSVDLMNMYVHGTKIKVEKERPE